MSRNRRQRRRRPRVQDAALYRSPIEDDLLHVDGFDDEPVDLWTWKDESRQPRPLIIMPKPMPTWNAFWRGAFKARRDTFFTGVCGLCGAVRSQVIDTSEVLGQPVGSGHYGSTMRHEAECPVQDNVVYQQAFQRAGLLRSGALDALLSRIPETEGAIN